MDTTSTTVRFPLGIPDTALPTRMEDIKTTSLPLRLVFTEICSSKNCPPMKGLSTKKKLTLIFVFV